DLIPEVEARAVLAVWAAVNIDDEVMFGGRGHANGLGEEGFDFEAIVVAHEGGGFDFAELLSGEEFGVEIGELACRGCALLEVELGEVAGSGEAVSDGAAFADRPRAHRAGISDHDFRLSAGDGQADEMRAAALLEGEVDGIA